MPISEQDIADYASMHGVTREYARKKVESRKKINMSGNDESSVGIVLRNDGSWETLEEDEADAMKLADAHREGSEDWRVDFEMNPSYKEGGEVPDIEGDYLLPNDFGSFTSIIIWPVDKDANPSKDFFSVISTVRSKVPNKDIIRVQKKPMHTYPIEKYNAFMEDLKARGARKSAKREPVPDSIGGEAKDKFVREIADKHGVSMDQMVEQLKIGMKHEMEHTTDERIAYLIAKDHVWENPLYYTMLEKTEKKPINSRTSKYK